MNWTEDEYNEFLKRTGKAAAPQQKRNKYNARRVTVDGISFDSRKEADYYSALKLQLRAGLIKGFCRQPRFPLTENSLRAVEYVSDFIVFNNDGTADIVDVKGMETDVFRLKMKQMRERFPKLEVKLK